ncbi:MAG: hypothetical protein ACPG4T_11585 [Nannocystaceae bacterium]
MPKPLKLAQANRAKPKPSEVQAKLLAKISSATNPPNVLSPARHRPRATAISPPPE